MNSNTSDDSRSGIDRIVTPVTEIFGLSRALAMLLLLLVTVVLVLAIYWFFHSAPPRTLIITTGPAGSAFQTNAEKYLAVLASNGVHLKIIPSEGSEENLKRLNNPKFKVDVGFVQGGITNGLQNSKLVSLGSIAYEPLVVFYRGVISNGLFSELNGQRLAIGPKGSGTHSLALTLLGLNGITNGSTVLLDLDAAEAAKALTNGAVDAVFLMGDSASPQIMRQLLLTPGVHLMNVSQADGYTRRISYLGKLELPMGSIDFGKNIPATNLQLIGPTVEILARPDLHPALIDLLLEAAQHVHGKPGLFQRKDEFPSTLEHDFPISEEADRFHKSGKVFLYRHLPFWLASLVNRIVVAFVPLLVLVIPAVKAIPALYKWRVRLLIYRRYRALLALERELAAGIPAYRRNELMERLGDIEASVNKMKVPASFAEQFYSLRGHIVFVRTRLMENVPPV